MGNLNNNVPDDVAGTWGTPLQYNGTAFETVRANFDTTVFASATRSATVTSSALTNFNHQGAVFFVNVTSVPGSGSALISLVIQGQDPVSGNYVGLWTAGSISAVGTFAVSFHPGITSGAASVPSILPRNFRVLAGVSAGATSKDVVFSVGMSFVK